MASNRRRRGIRYACAVNSSEPAIGDPSGDIERAARAYATLAELGETIEDEWQYVTDLVEAYLPAIRALRLPAGEAGLEAAAALDEAITEIDAITDPHRAIDWLSTFPHVAALAVGGDVDGGAGGNAPGSGSADATEPDDDNPFAILRRGRR
jgi:hypothetical protein